MMTLQGKHTDRQAFNKCSDALGWKFRTQLTVHINYFIALKNADLKSFVFMANIVPSHLDDQANSVRYSKPEKG